MILFFNFQIVFFKNVALYKTKPYAKCFCLYQISEMIYTRCYERVCDSVKHSVYNKL